MVIAELEKSFRQAGFPSMRPRRLVTDEPLRVQREPGSWRPVGADVRDFRTARGAVIDVVRADVEPPEAAGRPRRLPGDVRRAGGQEAVQVEGGLRRRRE